MIRKAAASRSMIFLKNLIPQFKEKKTFPEWYLQASLSAAFL